MQRFLRQFNHIINQFLMPVLTASVIVSLTLVALGSWNNRQLAQNFSVGISDQFALQQLSGQIIHLDEVLTMSSRMAAATGDSRWEARYRNFEPQLDTAIKRAIELAPETFDNHTVQTDKANVQLVAMENQAFALVRAGAQENALAVLFSDDYQQQKEIYSEGIENTNRAIQQRISNDLNNYRVTLEKTSQFSLISLIVLAVAWLIILGLLAQHFQWRKRAEARLQQSRQVMQQHNIQLRGSQIKLEQKAVELENALDELQQAQLHIVQSEKMSSLGHLVAGIAHEINNPVSFIYGNLLPVRNYANDLLHMIGLYQQQYPQPTSVIQQGIADVELEFIQTDLPNTLNSIEIGAERIRDIVLSLRNFSRMDESPCKAVDIHEGIDNTLLILNHRLKAQSFRGAINVKKHYGELPLVECYPGSLNQVFMNILSNAIDALDEKTMTLDAQATIQATIGEIMICTRLCDDSCLEIEIADNGPGMSAATQKKIFEPFFTTKPLGKGTGMGMPISYQIVVEKHGGQMAVTSTPKKGTKFVIQIPISQSASSLNACP